MKRKRMTAAFLVVLMLFALLPAGAQAADGDKLIALTFDDGPSQYTPALLDGLAARGAHVSFFVQGINGGKYPSTVRRAWLEGHQICSHTYSHPQLTQLSAAQIHEQLDKADTILDSALGFDQSYLLRPPYGAYNQAVLNTAGVPCFYWSVDTRDWESRNADAAYNEFIKAARDGSIVLMHDVYSTTVTAALRAVDTLQAQGYTFVTLSELFYRRGVTLSAGSIYRSAYPGAAGTADGVTEPVIQAADTAAGKQVTIAGDRRGAVYYTINGEAPTPANSTRYTGPFLLPASATVKAVSVLAWNGIRSGIVTRKIEYLPTAAPVITLQDGMLTMRGAAADAVIRYTTDGSVPTAESAAYTGAIAAAPGTTYRARAFAPGYAPSVVTQLTYGAHGSVFADVQVTDWYYAAADRAVAEGLFKGTADTVFSPNVRLSRAMLVTVLHRMAGEPEGAAACTFTDVRTDGYYSAALCWAAEAGIVKGYPNGTFAPDSGVTRQELCAMLARYLTAAGKTLSGGTGGLGAYADGGGVSAWAREAVAQMCALGVVQGYTNHTLQPGGGATRAEAATMLLRLEDAMPGLPGTQRSAARV